MNPFLPFVGLSLVVHISVIAYRKSGLSLPKNPDSQPLSPSAARRLSLCVICAVLVIVVAMAGFIIRTSVTDGHSNLGIALSLLDKNQASAALNPSPPSQPVSVLACANGGVCQIRGPGIH